MEDRLIAALQEIRYCRNNMLKEEFLGAVRTAVEDVNVLSPIVEMSVVCDLAWRRKLNEVQDA